MLITNPHPGDPLRPVDWRAQVAEAAADTNRALLSGTHDGLVAQVVQYLRRERAYTTPGSQRRLREAMPDLAAALDIRRDPRGATRSLVEACVLADQPAQEIARRAGVRPGAIRWYERVYFDVRDRLGRTEFVIHDVIGIAELDRDDLLTGDNIWKLLAYLGGTPALEAVTLGRLVPERRRSFSEGLAALSDSARIALHYRLLTAMAKLDAQDARSAAQLAQILDRVDVQMPDVPDEQGMMERQVASMLHAAESAGIGLGFGQSQPGHEAQAREARGGDDGVFRHTERRAGGKERVQGQGGQDAHRNG